MASTENRRSPRVAAPNVMVRVSTAERFRAAYLKDLSEGGLFIKTEKPLPIGREVVVDLFPPGFTVPLRLAAIVVRHGEPGSEGMGVRFQDVEAEAHQALRTLITTYEQPGAGSNAAPRPAADTAKDLETLLEQYAILKTTLETREKELSNERERHEAASHRALKLADELEAARTHSDRTPGSSPAADELHRSLAEKEVELSEARMRISELEGSLDAYRTEVQVLEEDDANSRRLAGALAQEKLGLVKEAQRLAAELKQERETAQEQLKQLEERVEVSDSTAKELLQSMQADLDARQLAVSQQGSKAVALEAQLAEQIARQAAFDGELRTLRAENGALVGKLKQAERTASEATGKLERLKVKERELRSLLSAVSTRAAPADAGAEEDEEVVIEEPANSETPLAAVAAPAPAAVAVEPAKVAVTPDEGIPQEFEVNEEVNEEEVDISVETAPQTPAGQLLSAAEFEKRLRANQQLKKTSTFGTHESGEEAMNKVKGLLEAGERFSQLMVLGRGLVTPPQLIDVLYRLHAEGAISMEHDK